MINSPVRWVMAPIAMVSDKLQAGCTSTYSKHCPSGSSIAGWGLAYIINGWILQPAISDEGTNTWPTVGEV